MSSRGSHVPFVIKKDPQKHSNCHFGAPQQTNTISLTNQNYARARDYSQHEKEKNKKKIKKNEGISPKKFFLFRCAQYIFECQRNSLEILIFFRDY